MFIDPSINVFKFSFRKNVRSVLGWIVLCVAMLALGGVLALDKRMGYGSVRIDLTLNGKPYVPSQQERESLGLLLDGKTHSIWTIKALRLRPGVRSVVVNISGRAVWQEKVRIIKDCETLVSVQLESIPRDIHLTNLPLGTELYSEARRGVVSTSCVITNVRLGKQFEYTLRSLGFYPHTNRLYPTDFSMILVVSNHPLVEVLDRVSVDVVPKGATDSVLKTRLLKEAKWILAGTTNQPGLVRSVNVGRYTIQVQHDDFLPEERQLVVQGGMTNRLVVELQPRPATLIVETTPQAKLTDVREGDVQIRFEENTVQLSPGRHSLKMFFSPEYEPIMDYSIATEPNRTNRVVIPLMLAGSLDFSNATQRIMARLSPEHREMLSLYGRKAWEEIESKLTTTLNSGSERPAEASRDLRKIESEILALLPKVNASATREAKRKQQAKAIRLALQQDTMTGFSTAAELLNHYREYYAEDAEAVLLYDELQSALIKHAERQTDRYLVNKSYLDARAWLEGIHDQLKIVTRGYVFHLMERVNKEELSWAKQQRLAQIQNDISSENFRRASTNLVDYLDRFSTEKGADQLPFVLVESLKSKRLEHYKATLQRMVQKAGYDKKRIGAELEGFTIACGEVQDRKVLEELVFKELLARKDWHDATAFLDTFRTPPWSKDELVKLGQEFRERKFNHLLENRDWSGARKLLKAFKNPPWTEDEKKELRKEIENRRDQARVIAGQDKEKQTLP